MSKVVKVALAALGGFAAGILMAPKSGKETRQDIKIKTDELKETAKEKAAEVRAAGKEAAQTLKKSGGKAGKEVEALSKSARSTAD